MKHKKYIYHTLSKAEEKYIRGIISRTIKDCIRTDIRKNLTRVYSINDLNFNQRYLSSEDNYKFVNINEIKFDYNKNSISISQRLKIIHIVEKLLNELGNSILIKKLDSNEKIIIYLLCNDITKKRIADLLNISDMSVYYRIRKIRKLFKEYR